MKILKIYTNTIGLLGVSSLGLLIGMSGAFADNTPAKTVATAKPKVSDKITIGYFGIFSGPSLGSPSDHQPDEMGVVDNTDDKSRIVLKSALSAGYKLTPTITTGPVFNFNYFPVFPIQNQGFSVSDPAVMLVNNKAFHTDQINVLADFRFYLPVSNKSQKENLITAIRALQLTTYEFKESRFSLGVYTFEKTFIRNTAASPSAVNFEFYSGPYVQYQINKETSVNLMYEFDLVHNADQSLTSWALDGSPDLMLGLSWDMTPTVNLNPYLQVYPGGKVTLDATQFGAYISAKLL